MAQNNHFVTEQIDSDILDLCSGLGGATRAFKEQGYSVTTVDYNERFHPDIIADINNLHIEATRKPLLIWSSPECTDYSKRSLPASWKCNRGQHTEPDMRLFLNCYRIIRYLNPAYWVIENVRGAVPYFSLVLGEPVKRVNSRVLWGEFPIFDTRDSGRGNKWYVSPGPDRAAIRSEIPYGISKALCQALAMVV